MLRARKKTTAIESQTLNQYSFFLASVGLSLKAETYNRMESSAI